MTCAGRPRLLLSTWTHLAGTYNGSTLTLYLNGVSIGTLATTGAITTSTGGLKIGGNSLWPEWFQGDIDEVRIYNRALSAAEIQADMNTSVGNPDNQAPTTPAVARRDRRPELRVAHLDAPRPTTSA